MQLSELETKRAQIEEEKTELTNQIESLSQKREELSAQELLDGLEVGKEIQATEDKITENRERLNRLLAADAELSRRIGSATKEQQEEELKNLLTEYQALGTKGKKHLAKFTDLAKKLAGIREELNALSSDQGRIKGRLALLSKEIGISYTLPAGCKVIPPTGTELEQARKALG